MLTIKTVVARIAIATRITIVDIGVGANGLYAIDKIVNKIAGSIGRPGLVALP